MKIGIISDTHSYIDDRILHHFEGCDLIMHAGDVGDIQVLMQLNAVAPVQCVFGNIDGSEIRAEWPEFRLLELDGFKFLLIHIAGAIGNYNSKVRALINKYRPMALVCGHSHLLKIQRDDRFNLLYINPGAAGTHGFHKMRTLLRFEIIAGKLMNLEVVELGPRSAKSVN